jgi:hypothetical protein
VGYCNMRRFKQQLSDILGRQFVAKPRQISILLIDL